jgi:hypothetical protein
MKFALFLSTKNIMSHLLHQIEKCFIIYIIHFSFYIPNILITLLHKAFLQYNSITKRVIISCLNVIVNCSLRGHVHITDHHLMNELLFNFKELEVIALMNSRSEACTHKINSITVSIYQLSVYE